MQMKKNKYFLIIGIVILVIIIIGAGYLYRSYSKSSINGVVTKNLIPFIHDASIDKRINRVHYQTHHRK